MWRGIRLHPEDCYTIRKEVCLHCLETNEATAAASFTVINTGNVDGFTTVEMVAQREVISSNRYFVAAGARQIKSLIAPNLHCSMSFDEISIRVGTIEPA